MTTDIATPATATRAVTKKTRKRSGTKTPGAVLFFVRSRQACSMYASFRFWLRSISRS